MIVARANVCFNERVWAFPVFHSGTGKAGELQPVLSTEHTGWLPFGEVICPGIVAKLHHERGNAGNAIIELIAALVNRHGLATDNHIVAGRLRDRKCYSHGSRRAPSRSSERNSCRIRSRRKRSERARKGYGHTA